MAVERVDVARLLDLHEALGRARTSREVAQVAIDVAVSGLAARAAAVSLLRDREVGTALQRGYRPEDVERYAVQHLDAREPVPDAIRAGAALYFSEPAAGERDYPALDWRTGLGAHAVLPLSAGGHTFGALTVSWEHPQPFSTSTRTVLEAYAGLVAQSLWRARLAEAADEARSELADLVNTTTIGLHWVGADGTILWANEADHAILGYRRDEYVGHNIAEFHLDQADLQDILARLLRGERIVDRPARLRHKDGSIRDVIIDSSSLFKDGKFVHTRCFTRDVTESLAHRKETERVLREQRDLYDTLLRAVSDLGEGVGLSRGSNQIVYINEAFARIAARNVSELLSDRFDPRTLFPPDEIERIMQQLQGKPESDPRHYQTRIQRPDGTLVDVEIASLAISINGEPHRLGLVRDVSKTKASETELERARRRLAQSEKLAALGQLVSGVAHEVRTPLTIIETNAHVLGLRAQRALETRDATPILDALPRATDEIVAAIDRANGLVKQLQRFTRKETEPHADVDFGEAVREAVALFEAANRGGPPISLVVEATPTIRARASQVQQAVINLLDNAAEASKHTTEPIRVHVRHDRAQRAILLRVSDAGRGISDDVQARMYEPLFSTKPDGTGLGLSIVRQIVDDHGGRIACESRVGVGTTFTLTFPAERAA